MRKILRSREVEVPLGLQSRKLALLPGHPANALTCPLPVLPPYLHLHCLYPIHY